MTKGNRVPLSKTVLPSHWSSAHNINRLERVVRDASANKEYDKIRKIVEQLCHDYAYAVHQPHARNGGLIGLAAASIGLGSVIFFFSIVATCTDYWAGRSSSISSGDCTTSACVLQ
jgi:hypothetical protein